jgi:thiol-disulfide isomerase/thioredoxin
MNWKLYAVIFTVLGLLVGLVYVYSTYGKESFQNSTPLDKPRLSICYADWCGHCQAAKPSFEEISKDGQVSIANGTVVVVRMLNADDSKNESELKRLKVAGYPTLILETTDGKTIEFKGERTTQAYLDFLNKHLGGGIQ